jgi:hypothetical protein
LEEGLSKVLLYIPRERVTDNDLWQNIRQWQKASGFNWDKIRCTPTSIGEKDIAREEMKSALHMIRKGSFEKVVYAELPTNYKSNLEWLLFAFSCQGQNLSVETLSGPVELPDNVSKLAAGLPNLANAASTTSSRKKRPTELNR